MERLSGEWRGEWILKPPQVRDPVLNGGRSVARTGAKLMIMHERLPSRHLSFRASAIPSFSSPSPRHGRAIFPCMPSLSLPPPHIFILSSQSPTQTSSSSPSFAVAPVLSSNPSLPLPTHPPTNEEIDAVIQQATSSVASDGRHVPLKDTRTQLFVGNVRFSSPLPSRLFDFPSCLFLQFSRSRVLRTRFPSAFLFSQYFTCGRHGASVGAPFPLHVPTFNLHVSHSSPDWACSTKRLISTTASLQGSLAGPQRPFPQSWYCSPRRCLTRPGQSFSWSRHRPSCYCRGRRACCRSIQRLFMAVSRS